LNPQPKAADHQGLLPIWRNRRPDQWQISGYAHPRHAGQGLHARQKRRTRLRKLKGTEHRAKVIADVQFYNGERGESLPETMMSNTTNEDDFVLPPTG